MRFVKFYFFLSLLIVVSSCSYSRVESNVYNIIIKDIYKQIIIDTNEILYPIYPPLPPPQMLNIDGSLMVDSIQDKKYREIMSKIDEKRFVFSIEDSTDNSIVDTNRIKANLEREGLLSLLVLLRNHEAYDSLRAKPILIDSIKKISTSDFNNGHRTQPNGTFEFIKRSQILPHGYSFNKYFDLNVPYCYFGNLIFSSPFLDETAHNGFIILKRHCGFECDSRKILVIKKQNDKWIIVKKINF